MTELDNVNVAGHEILITPEKLKVVGDRGKCKVLEVPVDRGRISLGFEVVVGDALLWYKRLAIFRSARWGRSNTSGYSNVSCSE